MDIKTYQAEAENTKSEQFNVPSLYNDPAIHTELFTLKHMYLHDIIHAIIGISTEAGELLDPVKKMMFYGKPLDMVNLDEEIGDLLWYIAIYANARKTTIEALATTNNAKLRARYPDKFTSEKALNRNFEQERTILESAGSYNIKTDYISGCEYAIDYSQHSVELGNVYDKLRDNLIGSVIPGEINMFRAN